MKIFQYNGPWQFSLEQSPVPSPGADEVLVRSEAVGICGSDVHGYTGESGRRKAGMVMGHEAAGTVAAVGVGVESVKTGDVVEVYPTLGCKECKYCQAGQEQLCPNKRILGVNAGMWGAMGEYFTCHARQVFALGVGTDPAVGLFAEPLAVALHAVNRMNPAPDAVLAIVGAGTIGLALAVVLAGRGHRHVYIIDKVEEKLAFARTLGAQPIHAEREDAVEVIAARTGGRAAGVFEAVGAAATVRRAYELCDFGGTVVLVGNLAQEFTLPLQGVTSNETTLRGSYGFNRDEFGEAARLAAKNAETLRHFITGSCTLEETPGIMDQLARGTLLAMKMIIRPQQTAATAEAAL